VDADGSWLALVFPAYLALSAFLFDAEAAFVSQPRAGTKLAAHIAYSGEHPG
jgi:hypothetical protein